MKYTASKDWLVKLITFITIGVTLITGYLAISHYLAYGFDNSGLAFVATFIVLCLLLIGTYLLAPIGYTLNDTDLIISRTVNEISIPLTSIKSVVLISNDKNMFGIRTFGVGGLFGYYGRFRYTQIGSVKVYATQRKNRILIHLNNDKKIIITPDDPNMTNALKKAVDKSLNIPGN